MVKNTTKILLFLLVSNVLTFSACAAPKAKNDGEAKYPPVAGRWSTEKINAWYADQPWLVGCNYYPSTAINQIDMWQASTWDPTQIDKELGWAAGIGMNTLRVYLHDLVWADDEKGLYKRMDEFLDICQKHGIRPWFVFFDDCHFPNPKLGVQPLPVKAYHNSGWVNCPARDVALRYAKGQATKAEVAQLKGYVQKTIAHFKDDQRVLMWELYNEPGRGNGLEGDMGSSKVKSSIGEQSNKLVYDSWVWARQVNPSQPIMSNSSGAIGKRNIAINRMNSDLHSIHSYGGDPGKGTSASQRLREEILEYQKDGRPVIVTEWLARDKGSTVQTCLPVMKELNAGAVNWGFVSGKSATIWNWESRRTVDGKRRSIKQERLKGNFVKPGEPMPEPDVWFHDLFRIDGTPFDQKEIDIFRELTGIKKSAATAKNVLFFFVDDLRPELGCYGASQIKSPNIDKLAAEGVLFERAYCQQAVCAPSRASLMAGQYPDTLGIYDLGHPLRRTVPDVMSLPRYFHEKGYVTASFGKTYHHFGDDEEYWTEMPDKPGQFYSNPKTHELLKQLEKQADAKKLKGLARYMATQGPSTEAADVADNVYQDGAVADQAIESIRRNRNKPFFLCVGFIKPHLPFTAPQKYWNLYQRNQFEVPSREKPDNVPDLALTNWGELRSYQDIPGGQTLLDDAKARQLIHAYAACVSFIDAQVGRVMDELQQQGLRDDTIVVLWGDHGWKLGDYGMWCKHTNFELDTRVPFILSAPGCAKGQSSKALVEMVDVFPTLAEMTGGTVPAQCEGRSMAGLLKDPSASFRDYAISQYPRQQEAVMGYSLRTDCWRYTKWVDSWTFEVLAEELYNLSETQKPMQNLAGEPKYAEQIKQFSAMIKPHERIKPSAIRSKKK